MGNSALNKLKNLIGFGEDYDEEMDEMYNEPEEMESKPTVTRKQKVIPMNGQVTQTKIVVLKPKCFNDSTHVADELKARRPVVINVGGLDNDEARRVVDFIAGTIYGLNGNMQKVATGIFVATPDHVDILGEVLDSDGDSYQWSMF